MSVPHWALSVSKHAGTWIGVQQAAVYWNQFNKADDHTCATFSRETQEVLLAHNHANPALPGTEVALW